MDWTLHPTYIVRKSGVEVETPFMSPKNRPLRESFSLATSSVDHTTGRVRPMSPQSMERINEVRASPPPPFCEPLLRRSSTDASGSPNRRVGVGSQQASSRYDRDEAFGSLDRRQSPKV